MNPHALAIMSGKASPTLKEVNALMNASFPIGPTTGPAKVKLSAKIFRWEGLVASVIQGKLLSFRSNLRIMERQRRKAHLRLVATVVKHQELLRELDKLRRGNGEVAVGEHLLLVHLAEHGRWIP